MTLAARLVGRFSRVLVMDRLPEPPQTPSGWEYAVCDFKVLPDLKQAQAVYAVTDEDKINIRLALHVRSNCPDVPIIISLVQSRLGRKLALHLENFSFVSPPELAAQKFVDAMYAPAPAHAPISPVGELEPERDISNPVKIDPLVVRALGAISLMALSATVYFHYAENLSWIDAFYFVITLMATVGFGDISLVESTMLSKMIGIVLMVASVTTTAVVFALITDSLVSKRLALSFGRRRVKFSGHVIIVGVGSVGFKVIEELIRRGESVVVIEQQVKGRYMPSIYAKHLPVIIGDARLDGTLRDAGLLTAKALVSVTNDDLTNLEVGLNAKVLTPKLRVVLRIYDPLLALSLHERLDIHFAFSMSSIAAGALARLVENPD